MRLTDEVRAHADELREMTVGEAAAMPGLLGRMAAARLRSCGWYGYTETHTGRRVLIVRK